jgi:arylsulfatase A-like enzyme
MVDVMPTLLDLLGLSPQPEAQGVSLLPAAINDRPVRDSVSLGNALRTDRWKWIGEGGALFDIERDPGERIDRSADDRPTADVLAGELAALGEQDRASRRSADPVSAPVELDAEKREELKALGYLE